MYPVQLSGEQLPLEFRAAQIERFGRYVYDLVLSHWTCQQCGSAVPGAEPMAVPLVTYRSVADLKDNLLRAGQTAYACADLPACPCCGRTAALLSMEHHAHLADEGRDLVARWRPDAAADVSFWFWSRDHGYIPVVALSRSQQRAFLRDALLRAAAAHRDFDEVSEADAVLEEAIEAIPGEVALLDFVPWLNNRRRYSIAGAIAQSRAERFPDDPRGHFWVGQIQLEMVASGALEAKALENAAGAFERALELAPDGDLADAALGLANIQRLRGNHGEALERLNALLLRHPDHAEAMYTKGVMLLTGDPAAARECFERGALLRPDDPDYARGIERATAAMQYVQPAGSRSH